MQASINTYDNFANSINSDETKEQYVYCLTQFLKYCQLDLDSFLKLPRNEMTNLIVNYLLQRKASRQYKVVIFSAIKHACEMNDVVLNWTKMKKFIRTDNRDNSINGKDRGYTHEEIRKILEFSDQRSKTAFLLLASTGIRIGALQSIRIGDLERFDPSASPKTQTKIVQAKKKKKHYDKQGNEINDEQLLKDIANGINVISYNEVKSGEDKPQVVRK